MTAARLYIKEFQNGAYAVHEERIEGAVPYVGEPTVSVERVGDIYARLFVNGYGVATWMADAEVRNTGETGMAYAEECARVLRKALGMPEVGSI